MSHVDVSTAKTQLSRLLERVRAGEEIVITKRGKPFARLCPLAAPAPREPGHLEGDVEDSFFAPLPDEEIDAWEQ
jgi:prevent-host-death family protein